MRAARGLPALVFALVGAPLWADTVTLKPVADTTLHEEVPGNNLGKTVPMAGRNGHGKRERALFRFDVSSLPAGAVVSAVNLRLKVVRTPSSGPASNFDVRRILKSWGEGAKGTSGNVANQGAAATADEATWAARLAPSTLWAAAGGAIGTDFAATVSATTRIAGNAVYTFASSSSLVSDVQAWLADTNSNFGWVLLTQSESVARTVRRFGGRETPADAATLELTYSVPAPPQPPTLSRPQQVGDQIRFTFNAEANRAYTVETSSTLLPASWTVLRAVPASGAAASVEVTDTLGAPRAYYRVRTP